MIILGIDPGSHVTGYAFIEKIDRKLKVLEYGVIRCKPKDTLPLRLKYLCSTLRELLTIHEPQVLSIENVFFSVNAKSALILGQARGAILATCMEKDVFVKEYSPKEIKQFAVGRGSASKEQVAWMMQKHYQLKEIPKPHDASDALAAAWACHNDPLLKDEL